MVNFIFSFNWFIIFCFQKACTFQDNDKKVLQDLLRGHDRYGKTHTKKDIPKNLSAHIFISEQAKQFFFIKINDIIKIYDILLENVGQYPPPHWHQTYLLNMQAFYLHSHNCKLMESFNWLILVYLIQRTYLSCIRFLQGSVLCDRYLHGKPCVKVHKHVRTSTRRS